MFFSELEKKRQSLGLSILQLAKRSGVSKPTVQRTLTGERANPTFAHVSAIASALGLSVSLETEHRSFEMRKKQAEAKAKKLVALVQGSSGLEGQAVDSDTIREMIEETTMEFMSGSNRKLWSDV